MRFAWFVARRYLTARRRQAFISLISGVSIVGVGVGVMALVIALALMTGVQGELRDRIVGSTAHIYVYRIGGGIDDIDAEIERLTVPGVRGGAPAVMGVALVQSTGSNSVPVTLKGIVPTMEEDVTDIRAAVISGSLDGLVNRPEDAADGIVLGADLATSLGVSVGESLLVVTPTVTMGPYGAMPRTRQFEVVGLVKFGFYDTDHNWAYVSLATAENILNRDGPDLIQLALDDLDDAPAIRRTLESQLGVAYQIQDWTELNGPLYSALWLEKVAISLTIGLIVMVAALNIVASPVLLVMEKSRDVAILRTMGASGQMIRRIFMLQGLTIGLIGTVSGTVLGLIVSIVADRYRLISLPADVYQVAWLPFHVRALDVTAVVVLSVLVCFLATIYPARQAASLDPAEALRNQ
jgi:lipoprotein-releasing system permease protein